MNRTNLVEDLTLLPMPALWESPWFWMAFLLCGALAAGVLWWLWQRRRKSSPMPVVSMPEPDRTPEFLGRLEALRSRRNELGAYDMAIGCSDLLREFMEWRFRLKIRFQTTREFLESAVRDTSVPAAERERLGSFLRFCDLVKFARQGASLDEVSGLLDTAGAVIRSSQGKEGASS